MTLSDRSMYMIPHQGIGLPPFSLFLIRLFGRAQGRGWRRSILVLYILQSQKPDPMEKTSHTIRSRCACVRNFSSCNSHPFLHDSIFYLRYGLSFLSSLFLFFPFFILLGTDIPFFFIAHIFLQDEYQGHVKRMEHFFGEWKACFSLRHFHCRSQHMSC